MKRDVTTKPQARPQAFIDINGRRYDARNGRLLTAEALVISDMVPAVSVSAAATAALPSTSLAIPRPLKKVMDIRRPQPVQARRPQTAKTLMRSAVSKPQPGLKRHLKAATRTDILAAAPKDIVVAPKLSVTHVDPKRQQRSSRVKRSPRVEHFAAAEAAALSSHHPARISPEARADISARLQPEAVRSLDIFEKALAAADAHTEKPVNHKHAARTARHQAHRQAKPAVSVRHSLSLAAVSLCCLLLLGFVAYQNKAAITLRYASAKAGFHASLPAYQPSGFSVSKFAYQPGSVSVAFDNRVSQQRFVLSQKTTSLDDQDLLSSVARSNRSNYQVLQHEGQSLYVYGNNNAAWLSHGVLYQLKTQGNLSTSQILDVASSI